MGDPGFKGGGVEDGIVEVGLIGGRGSNHILKGEMIDEAVGVQDPVYNDGIALRISETPKNNAILRLIIEKCCKLTRGIMHTKLTVR